MSTKLNGLVKGWITKHGSPNDSGTQLAAAAGLEASSSAAASSSGWSGC